MHGWVNTEILPPLLFIADGMQYPVMCGTERHDPLVADLAPDRPRLGKTHMVGMAWQTPADEAGPGGHVAEMLLVPDPARRVYGKGRFVDLAWFLGTRVSIRIAVLTNFCLRVLSSRRPRSAIMGLGGNLGLTCLVDRFGGGRGPVPGQFMCYT